MKGPAMSLDAWEQRALDSIKDGLTGSDPELAALLSAFTWLTSDKDRPGGEEIQPRAVRRLRRARWRATFRKVSRRLGVQGAAVLLWLLATVALITVALSLNGRGDHAPCIGLVSAVCTSPAPEHGSGPASHDTTTDQAPQQGAVGTREAGRRPLGDPRS